MVGATAKYKIKSEGRDMDALGGFRGVCQGCNGTGVFDDTEGQYVVPLTDEAIEKGIELSSDDAALQDDYDSKDYSQAQAIYHQMGRNFGKFLQRNAPKAYFDGVTDKLAELAGTSPKFTR